MPGLKLALSKDFNPIICFMRAQQIDQFAAFLFKVFISSQIAVLTPKWFCITIVSV